MKKAYIAPEIDKSAMEVISHLAAGSGSFGKGPKDGSEATAKETAIWGEDE